MTLPEPPHDRPADERLGVHLGLRHIRDAAQGWMNMPLIAESLLGTFLWGLFIVAFSRKVIR